MGDIFINRYFVSSITGTSVQLSAEKITTDGTGGGLADVRVVTLTTQDTASTTFWGTAAACGRWELILRRMS